MLNFLLGKLCVGLLKIAAGFSAYGFCLACGVYPMFARRDAARSWFARFSDWLLLAIAIASLLPVVAYFSAPIVAKYGLLLDISLPVSYLHHWLISAAVGLAIVLLSMRYAPRFFDGLKGWLTLSPANELGVRSDVRELIESRMLSGDFDPTEYFGRQGQMFVGLNEGRQPVFIDMSAWRLSHALLLGRTRSGKGVAAQILLSQAIQNGEFVVVLDPKIDAWMPHVFWHAADQAKQPYLLLDLRPAAAPQINLFSGCDEETLENMFISAMGLAAQGDMADVYRQADRRFALLAARYIVEFEKRNRRAPTPAEVYSEMKNRQGDDSEGRMFLAALQELAELPSLNASQGNISIENLVQSGGCLYVFGDLINSRILMAQRMLLVRLMMLAKQRNSKSANRTITVFADEAKVHISKPFMTSLQASAGWGLHTILAFQSWQDLHDCPADLSPESVIGSISENCALKICYGIDDPDTAERFCRSTGTVPVDEPMAEVQRGLGLAETSNGKRALRRGEQYLIDMNTMLHLLPGCAVLKEAGQLAKRIDTSPVRVEPVDAAVVVSAAPAFSAEPARLNSLDLD